MTGRALWAGLGMVVVVVLNGGPLAAQDFDWSEPMESGEVLEVRGITGSIQAQAASGATARVTAEKHGRSSDFDDVEIRLIRDRDGYTVCAVYRPRDRDAESCSNNRHDDDDHRDRSIDVDVDFVVHVPAGVEFIGTMVTGDVEAEGLQSDVTATSVTGDVVVSTAGTVRANTVSGSMDIEMGRLDRNQRFNTVSGDITLRLPEDLDADVRFESLSGDLDSDFDLDVTDQDRKWIGSDIRATIGDGGHRLALKTVSGDVRLRRARGRDRVR